VLFVSNSRKDLPIRPGFHSGLWSLF
jgi:hypothetical protein